jgi:hypothetical protein
MSKGWIYREFAGHKCVSDQNTKLTLKGEFEIVDPDTYSLHLTLRDTGIPLKLTINNKSRMITTPGRNPNVFVTINGGIWTFHKGLNTMTLQSECRGVIQMLEKIELIKTANNTVLRENTIKDLEPVAYWPMDVRTDGYLQDFSGNDMHGRLFVRGPISQSYERGRFGTGFSSDGKWRRIRITLGEKLNFNDNFTIECWIYPKNTPAPTARKQVGILWFDDGRLNLTLDNENNLRVKAVTIDNKPLYSPLAKIPVKTWSHVAISYTNGELTLYVNGVPFKKTVLKNKLRKHGKHLVIGADALYKGGEFFEGVIDEVKIYKEALSQKLVMAHTKSSLFFLNPALSQIKSRYLPGEILSYNVATNCPPTLKWRRTLTAPTGETIAEKLLETLDLEKDEIRLKNLPDGIYTVLWCTSDSDGKKFEVKRTFNMVASQNTQATLKFNRLRKMGAGISALDTTFAKCGELLKRREFEKLKEYYDRLEYLIPMFKYGSHLSSLFNRCVTKNMINPKDAVAPILMDIFPDSVLTRTEQKAMKKWAEKLHVGGIIQGPLKESRIGIYVHDKDSPANKLDIQSLKKYRKDGFDTIALVEPAPPKQFIRNWTKKHPKQYCVGYWWAKQKASSTKLTHKLWRADFHFPPKDNWLVEDLDTQKILPIDEWSVNRKTKIISINSIPGHIYKIYYMFKPRLHSDYMELLYPEFQKQSQKAVEKWLGQYANTLDVFFTDGGYPYPGPTPQGIWDWVSYCYGALNPDGQKLFEQQSGMKFDPRLLFPGEKGGLEDVPSPEYLSWMRFKQEIVRQYWRGISGAIHSLGVKLLWYWGDMHVGVEPYQNGLEDYGIDMIDKPCSSPVDMRCLTGFEGSSKRVFRTQWLFYHTLKKPSTAEFLWQRWLDLKRAMCMKMPDNLYWMPMAHISLFMHDAKQREVLEVIRQINEEFLVMRKYMHGRKSYQKSLNLYIVNAWGKIYSWRPFGDLFLANLTDLPISIKFISIKEIAEKGVPADANVLLNYGDPNTAWSGGWYWEDPRSVASIRKFVANGGGLVGVGAPAYGKQFKNNSALSEIFGLRFKIIKTEKKKDVRSTFYGKSHWITCEFESQKKIQVKSEKVVAADFEVELENTIFNTNIAASPSTSTVKLLCSGDGSAYVGPLVTVNSFGKGRSVYINYADNSWSYYDLLKKSLYWASKKQKEFQRFHCTTPGVYAYLYSSEKLIVLINSENKKINATITLDASLLGESNLIGFRDLLNNNIVNYNNKKLEITIPALGMSLLKSFKYEQKSAK